MIRYSARSTSTYTRPQPEPQSTPLNNSPVKSALTELAGRVSMMPRYLWKSRADMRGILRLEEVRLFTMRNKAKERESWPDSAKG